MSRPGADPRTTAPLLLVGLLLLGGVPLEAHAGLTGATPSPNSPFVGAHPTASPPKAAPPSTTTYVLTEGLEFVQENDEFGIPPADVIADLTVPTSPRATAWALSGLSETGDRYLAWAGFYYPYPSSGCPTTNYSFGYEVDSSTGALGSAQCVPTLAPALGDQVEINLDLACGGNVGTFCLTFSDLTQNASATPSISQPTPTATYFKNANPALPNPYGFFTGPATLAFGSGTSGGCVDLSGLPTISYYLQGLLPTDLGPSGYIEENLTAYVAFVSEVDGTGTSCASVVSAETHVPVTPVTQYLSLGTLSDGSHWSAVQNWTRSVGRPSMGRFETDVVPMTAALQLSAASADSGQTVDATLTPGGGAPPYTCAWTVDGSPVPTSACTTTLPASGAGPENISGFVIDSAENEQLAWAPFQVNPDPFLGVPLATPSAVDLGRSVVFSASAVGGSGGYSYFWGSLPPSVPCTTPSAPTVTCTPGVTGTFPVSVSVNDSLGLSATSPTLEFSIYADPLVSMGIASGSFSPIDVGQAISVEATVTGGLAPYSYAWTSTASPCESTADWLTCRGTVAGAFTANVTVTDATGYSISSGSVNWTVDPPLTVNLTVSPSSIGAGANFTASAKVVGGAGGVQYAWYGLPSDCQVGSGATVTCTPGTAGEYNLSVTVRDRAGVEASAAGTLEVRPGAAPSANPWGGPIGITIALGSVIGLVAVAVVVVRSRRRRPPPPTTEYVIVSGPRVVPPRRP